MAFPSALRSQILDRFGSLIAEGQSIHAAKQLAHGDVVRNFITREVHRNPDYYVFDWARIVAWRTGCVSLLGMFLPEVPVHKGVIPTFAKLPATEDGVNWALGTLRALKEDFASGLFDSLASRIEAELTADLMTQARSLVDEGDAGSCPHVPAAVLAGAVLEKALRSLCDGRTPPVPTTGADGKPAKAAVLIDALKKAGAYNETAAKQLRAWTGIRNDCAHGEGQRVDREQVRLMIEGIQGFLAKHLG